MTDTEEFEWTGDERDSVNECALDLGHHGQYLARIMRDGNHWFSVAVFRNGEDLWSDVGLGLIKATHAAARELAELVLWREIAKAERDDAYHAGIEMDLNT